MVSAASLGADSAYGLPRTQAAPIKAPSVSDGERESEQDKGPARVAAQPAGRTQPVQPLPGASVSGDTFSALLETQEADKPQAAGRSDSVSDPKARSADGQAVDLDGYFSNAPGSNAGPTNLRAALDQLILPTAENVQAIQEHASARFKDLLADYGIPEAPSQITYDNEGQIHFPADYPYTDDLTQALSENPGLSHELSSLNAITDQYVGMQKALAFSEEYSTAETQSQADAVIAKYSDLFSGRSTDKNIALSFSSDGSLSLSAGGSPIEFT